jgi:hypothetical protein
VSSRLILTAGHSSNVSIHGNIPDILKSFTVAKPSNG